MAEAHMLKSSFSIGRAERKSVISAQCFERGMVGSSAKCLTRFYLKNIFYRVIWTNEIWMRFQFYSVTQIFWVI